LLAAAEIADFNLALGSHEDVGRLDVAVDDFGLVEVDQSVEDLFEVDFD
jgi:hypothetical protein